ncbi:MAG: shikimate kinase [Vicinamibacterales bacterium]
MHDGLVHHRSGRERHTSDQGCRCDKTPLGSSTGATRARDSWAHAECGTGVCSVWEKQDKPDGACSAAIRLVGPGGAGKSTVGALLAERLSVAFVDLDRCFADHFGDVGAFIERFGYGAYARENVETYRALPAEHASGAVVALSSGFMTYDPGVHPDYARIRGELHSCSRTFVLLPFLERERCVAETIRRQVARPFGRSPDREEAVIRARFEIYMGLPMPKIETMRPASEVVDEIIAVLWLLPPSAL